MEGFDIQAGLNWIYPTNYSLREYQFNIIQEALFKNTLVSLPTGLGKTFIAAVVMYNFYRWYPTGKIIFIAPTKPLVKQQVDACYDIMAIPKNVTAELTGSKVTSRRNDIWTEKRVFYITPQVLQNDLDTFPDLGPSIKCIVFDEAHKAKGNYSYCEVIKKLKETNQHFRVLALSATPGNSFDAIGEVITNLLISHVEFRTEQSIDVKPYVFERKLEIIVVPLNGKLEQVKSDYNLILDKYVRTLIRHKVIVGNCSTLTKGRIFMILKSYKGRNPRDSNYNEVVKTLNICLTLYHAYDLLIRHGLRSFLTFYETHIDKPLLNGNTQLLNIMEDVRNYLGPTLKLEELPDGSYANIPPGVKYGHPKYYKLRDILLTHFENNNDSRVIVFFEYRDSVTEALCLLLQSQPTITAKLLLGQKDGITQRSQYKVIEAFRNGKCNTLLSTCIGEEGLDVGEVDLIVCFDVSSKSPIRMIQRMGRTGRKREGQIRILVTEGKEQQNLDICLIDKNNIKNWFGSTKLLENFYVKSPRMVPDNINPQCLKLQITVENKINSIQSMFKSMNNFCDDDVEIVEIEEKLPNSFNLFDKSKKEYLNFDFKPNYQNYLENQRKSQCGKKIKSSDDSNLLISLMNFADSKRFNIPLTQGKNLKQSDIRNMFKSNEITSSQEPFVGNTQITQAFPSSKINDLNKKFYTELANYLSIQLSSEKFCKICNNSFKCNKNNNNNETVSKRLNNWTQPNINIIENLTLNNLEMYDNLINPKIRDDYYTQMVHDENLTDFKNVSFKPPKSFENLVKSTIKPSVSDENENKEIDSDLLKFFKLDKIEDVLESNEFDDLDDYQLSPILGTQKTKKDIEEPKSPINNIQSIEDDELSKSPIIGMKNFVNQRNSSQKLNDSNELTEQEDSDDENLLGPFGCKRKSSEKKDIPLDEFIDFESFGLDLPTKKTKNILEISSQDMFDEDNQKENETLNFDNFKNDLFNEQISTQINLKPFDPDETVIIEQEKEDDDCMIIINDSPVIINEKLPEKRKVLSQMTISQIMSLVQKPTQITQSTLTNKKLNNTSNRSKLTSVSSKIKENILKKKNESINRKKITQITQKSFNKSIINVDSDDDFEEPNTTKIYRKTQSKENTIIKPIKKKVKNYNEFIEREAEVTMIKGSSTDDENSNDEDDHYDPSFVDDQSIRSINTQMHVKYLKSVKSPKGGVFKIPFNLKPITSDIYSQSVVSTDSYVNDSFCVNTQDVVENDEKSELDILEEMLKRKKRKPLNVDRKFKRKRIVTYSDSD